MVHVECPNPSLRQISDKFSIIFSRVESSTSLRAMNTHDKPQSQFDFCW